MGAVLREDETYVVKDELNDRQRLVSPRRDVDIVTEYNRHLDIEHKNDNTVITAASNSSHGNETTEYLEDTDNEYHDIDDESELVVSEQNSECGDVGEIHHLLGHSDEGNGQDGLDDQTQDRWR